MFLDDFSNILDTLNDNRNILICGDFNLHLDDKDDNYVNEFIELFDSHDLENMVNKPTSLQNHTIDLVIQNKNNKIVCEIDVEPECVISPVHKLVLFSLNVCRSRAIKKRIKYRNKTNFDAEEFIDKCAKEIKERDLKCECNFKKKQVK